MTPLLTTFATVVAAEWDHLAAPGARFTGAQRVAIAAAGRWVGDELPATGAQSCLSASVEEAARRVAGAPPTIRTGDIERWAHGGLDVHAYLELVDLVTKMAGLDVAAFGLGLDREPLPVSRTGEPSRQIPAALYRPSEPLSDLGTEHDSLSPLQIELIAARTSAVNRCGAGLAIHTAKLWANSQHHGAIVDCAPIERGYSRGDCGVPAANEIFALVDAAILGDLDEYPDARIRAELALDRDAADRVALAAGHFTMMNHLMNATSVISAPR